MRQGISLPGQFSVLALGPIISGSLTQVGSIAATGRAPEIQVDELCELCDVFLTFYRRARNPFDSSLFIFLSFIAFPTIVRYALYGLAGSHSNLAFNSS
jgi:hypothetical protein